MEEKKITEQKALDARRKFVTAFNNTMVKIWKERITLLDVIDTGQLLHSPAPLRLIADPNFTEVTLSQEFLEYGVWQNYGTGKEVYRGNPGDIGRPKVRKKKAWYFRKYYASVMRIKEFYADNLGQQFCGIIADSIHDDLAWRHKIWPSKPVG